MPAKPIWKQRSSHHFILEHGDHCIELRYEDAGFQSHWAVYDGNRVIGRTPEFMQARGVALRATVA